jgi:hypothetical protein
MKKQLVLVLEENEIDALEELSEKEFRSVEQQTVLIIREQLEKAGLIESSNPMTRRPFKGLKEINE